MISTQDTAVNKIADPPALILMLLSLTNLYGDCLLAVPF